MKRSRLLPAVLILACGTAWGQFPDAYQAISGLLGVDPNEGLTVFLSTLVPMGGLQESMGMAYTAVARDASFLESNPAGSSVLEKTELSLFHNNWIQDTRIEGAVYSVRFGQFGVSFGGKWLYTQFTERDDFGDRVNSGYYSEAIGIANGSIRLFPGYYFFGMALGGNIKAAFRSVPDYGDENGVLIPGSGASQSAFGVMADFGLLTKFNLLKFYSSREKNLSIGLAFKNVGAPVMGEPLPTVGSAGIAYSPFRPILVSLDVSLPVNLVDPASSERPYAGIGGLVQVTESIAMHGGILVKGGNPRISLGSSLGFAPMTLVVNWTVDLTTQLAPLNRLSVQVRFDMGDLGRGAVRSQVDAMYLAGLEAYAAGELETAIGFWEEALNLDPSFDPARENMEAARGVLELQDRMKDIQTIKP
ncbi:MAG: UPF0164 family protein [Spirochaetes bacterium]|nr:UPF0164 family protein [Spirochaetota bacterium]